MTFRIDIPASQHHFEAREGETILDAALRAGVHLPYGCRSGRCTTCKGYVLNGEVRYAERPSGLSKQMQEHNEALFCQAIPCSDVQIAIDELGQFDRVKVRRMPVKVAKLKQLSPDVMQLFLKQPEHIRLQFFAGQYLDILQEDGERRSFSIANAPHDDEFIELHIRHIEGGEYTQYIFERMKVGEILRIEAPLGSFVLREKSKRPLILMGGGTGFAPLKGIIEHAFHTQLERPIHLFWGARTRQDLYLNELPEHWVNQHPLFRYTPVLSEPESADNWQGEIGLVHEAVMQHYPDMSRFDVYMSGSPAMVYSARDAFIECGISDQHLYSDAFEFNSQMVPPASQASG